MYNLWHRRFKVWILQSTLYRFFSISKQTDKLKALNQSKCLKRRKKRKQSIFSPIRMSTYMTVPLQTGKLKWSKMTLAGSWDSVGKVGCEWIMDVFQIACTFKCLCSISWTTYCFQCVACLTCINIHTGVCVWGRTKLSSYKIHIFLYSTIDPLKANAKSLLLNPPGGSIF